MSNISDEIGSQPGCWQRAVQTWKAMGDDRPAMPSHGERVAAVGCGTSWFMAQSYASLREEAGFGETDAFAASEFPADRDYDRVVAISRSGTTTEVLRLLERTNGRLPTTAIAADADSPIAVLSGRTVTLGFADERSVVQTRFATSALAFLRASMGHDLDGAIADAHAVLALGVPVDVTSFDHFVFLGHGWTNGLASEAALKMREAARAHTESHPAMEYRHGPISVAGERSLVWILGTPDGGIADDVRATGASVLEARCDPMAELIMIQRAAVALAEAKGLDPDRPRNLTRSIVLS